MKKRILASVILLLFILAVKSNADMRISPDGVTTPDSAAAVRLTGSFSTTPLIPIDRNAAVFSGINSYTGTFSSYGGYFTAAGRYGRGVYGKATYSGGGPFGGTNFGGYFTAAGASGQGVYGYASNTGFVENYGGYFKADGAIGQGVYGRADGTSGKGVYGNASGISGRGIFGEAYGTSGIGVFGVGGLWDFYAAGSGGDYGPFTGAHEVKFAEDMPGEIVPGMIISVTGKTETRKNERGKISLSSTLPTVTISTQARDKAVFGVIVSDGPLPEDHWYEAEEGERFGVVNALGEGRVWVTDIDGEIRAGDYITTSSVPGYGQMQDDDLLHSYTLGKAIETVDFDQVNATISHNGKMYKAYLLAVVYTSG